MSVIYVSFGIFAVAFIFVTAAAIGIFTAKGGKKNKDKKGDYLSPKPEGKKTFNPFSDFNADGNKPDKAASPVHANCDHAKKPSPYIDVNDTYSMTWDEFKNFALKLLKAEYPTAHISPYKYRGSPDIQLQTGGKDVDVRLIFVRQDGAVDKNDFAAALKDVDENDDVSDWIITNGRFSIAQRSSASAKRVSLYDAADVLAIMRRCNVSAKAEMQANRPQ